METLILDGIIIVNLRNMHQIVNESKANLFKIPSGRIIHEDEVTKRGKRFVPGLERIGDISGVGVTRLCSHEVSSF